jgi:membrane protease YdiL (CAAX protease family)
MWHKSMTESTKRISLIGIAVLYLLAQNLIGAYFVIWLPFLDIRGTTWNWSGETACIIFSLLMVVSWPWLRQNVGLHWRQAPGSLKWSLVIFFTMLGCGIVCGLIDPMPHSRNTPDVLWFQATMPSIAEELSDRGILLALLERAFGQSPMSCRWRFGWASLIVSLLFWQGHGLYRVDTFFTGAAFAMVRTRSGSLVWPMLCHSAFNVGSAAVALI